MTNTTPPSAGETTAAPPDPWVKVEARRDIAVDRFTAQTDAAIWLRKSDVDAALATERQHHAAQLAEKDYVLKLAEQHWTEYKATEESLKADLTAARAERETLRAFLVRLTGWDHFDGAADGPYWRREIAALLADESQNP